ncbi:unnamed protein product [Discosporangium mesarthrocarpum]
MAWRKVYLPTVKMKRLQLALASRHHCQHSLQWGLGVLKKCAWDRHLKRKILLAWAQEGQRSAAACGGAGQMARHNRLRRGLRGFSAKVTHSRCQFETARANKLRVMSELIRLHNLRGRAVLHARQGALQSVFWAWERAVWPLSRGGPFGHISENQNSQKCNKETDHHQNKNENIHQHQHHNSKNTPTDASCGLVDVVGATAKELGLGQVETVRVQAEVNTISREKDRAGRKDGDGEEVGEEGEGLKTEVEKRDPFMVYVEVDGRIKNESESGLADTLSLSAGGEGRRTTSGLRLGLGSGSLSGQPVARFTLLVARVRRVLLAWRGVAKKEIRRRYIRLMLPQKMAQRERSRHPLHHQAYAHVEGMDTAPPACKCPSRHRALRRLPSNNDHCHHYSIPLVLPLPPTSPSSMALNSTSQQGPPSSEQAQGETANLSLSRLSSAPSPHPLPSRLTVPQEECCTSAEGIRGDKNRMMGQKGRPRSLLECCLGGRSMAPPIRLEGMGPGEGSRGRQRGKITERGLGGGVALLSVKPSQNLFGSSVGGMAEAEGGVGYYKDGDIRLTEEDVGGMVGRKLKVPAQADGFKSHVAGGGGQNGVALLTDPEVVRSRIGGSLSPGGSYLRLHLKRRKYYPGRWGKGGNGGGKGAAQGSEGALKAALALEGREG